MRRWSSGGRVSRCGDGGGGRVFGLGQCVVERLLGIWDSANCIFDDEGADEGVWRRNIIDCLLQESKYTCCLVAACRVLVAPK